MCKYIPQLEAPDDIRNAARCKCEFAAEFLIPRERRSAMNLLYVPLSFLKKYYGVEECKRNLQLDLSSAIVRHFLKGGKSRIYNDYYKKIYIYQI